jgi:hypothetical protein
VLVIDGSVRIITFMAWSRVAIIGPASFFIFMAWPVLVIDGSVRIFNFMA